MRNRVFGNPGAVITSAQRAGLNAASPAPSAANPFVTKDNVYLLPDNSAAFFVTQLKDAAAIEFVPAAPAGYCYAINNCSIRNDDAAQTGTYTITEGGAIANVSAAAIAASAVAALTFTFTTGSVKLACTGNSSGFSIIGSYTKVPLSVVQPWTAQLTSSYVALPALLPATGFVNRRIDNIGNVLGYYTVNGDTAATVPNIRVTRGAANFVFTLASVASLGKGSNTFMLPAILPTDTVEVKCSVAPNNAGTVVIGGAFQTVPLTT